MWVEGQNGTGGGDPLTPSNSTPAAIAQNHVYEAQGNGYAIESYNNVTPSNSSPVALTSGEIDKMGGNGYAIANYYNLNTGAPFIPTELYSGYFYKVTDSSTEYAYRKKMPYINPAEVYTEAIRNTTETYILKNSAGDREGYGCPLNYWLITAAFKTATGAETRGGTWLVVGTLDGRVNAGTLVELQKDSSVTNLTVTLNYSMLTMSYSLDIQSTATSYYYDIRIIRLTDNTIGY